MITRAKARRIEKVVRPDARDVSAPSDFAHSSTSGRAEVCSLIHLLVPSASVPPTSELACVQIARLFAWPVAPARFGSYEESFRLVVRVES